MTWVVFSRSIDSACLGVWSCLLWWSGVSGEEVDDVNLYLYWDGDRDGS